MPDLLRRPVVIVVLIAAVVAAVVVVLLLTGDDDAADTGAPAPTSSPPTPSPSPTRASPEEFCEAFRSFADAANLYTATGDEASAQALLETGKRLAATDPLGLSPGGQVMLDQLVNGSFDPLGESVELYSDGLPDAEAFELYLEEVCPA